MRRYCNGKSAYICMHYNITNPISPHVQQITNNNNILKNIEEYKYRNAETKDSGVEKE